MEKTVIFGPPGTGKTTRLMEILSKLLQEGYAPQEIAYVSFTREGANQGKNRAIKQFNFTELEFPYFATLHSLAFRHLKLRRSDVIQKKHYKIFSDMMGMNFTGYYTEEFFHNDDQYLFFNDLYRNNRKRAKMFVKSLDINKVNQVKENYRNFKKTYNLWDFTDMIDVFIDKNSEIPVKAAIIDEAQDLTTLQWQMITVAFKNCEKMFIAGDDDQAIFEWSGADNDYFMEIRGNLQWLNQSYRLNEKVLNVAESISKRISKRVRKTFKPTNEYGIVKKINSLEEVEIKKDETYMFLARNNHYVREIEKYIQEKGKLYFFKHDRVAKIKDFQAIRLFEDCRRKRELTREDESKLRPYMEKIDIRNAWYHNFQWPEKKKNYYKNILADTYYPDFDNINIKVSTIHTVKGDEADNVILCSDMTRNAYENLQENPDSEHRVFYVACTRAKNNLYVLDNRQRFKYNILD